MAQSDLIKSEEIIQKDLFKNTIQSSEELTLALLDTAEALKLIQKESAIFLKANQNPKTAEDLKKVTNELDKANKARKGLIETDKLLLQLQKQSEIQNKKILDLEKKIADQKAKQAKQTKEISAQEKVEQQLKKQRAKEEEQILKAKLVLQDKEAGNEAKIQARLTLLRIERARLTGAEANYLEQVKRINSEIDKENHLLNTLSDKQKQAKANVGNYTESVREAIDSSELFSKALGNMNESNSILVTGFQQLHKNLGTVKEALSNADTTSKKLGLTLKAVGIGLLISALASLGAMFTSSREGGQKFTLLINNITAVINVLVGRLSLAGNAIMNTFKNLANVLNPITLSMTFYKDGIDGVIQSFKNVGTGIGDISKIFTGFTDDVKDQQKALDDLSKATFEYENELRKLQLTQLNANLNEEDANEIAQDETRTIEERTKALKQGIRERELSAKIGVKIAETEQKLAMQTALASLQAKNVTDEELKMIEKRGAEYLVQSKFADKLTKDELDNLNEKVKAYITADDALSDLPRQEATRQAKLIQDLQAFDIELILKKKLNASSEIAVLTKKVADEKQLLSDREKYINDLNAKEQDSLQAQINIFNQAILKENELNKGRERDLKQTVDFNKLIAEQDAVKLARDIKNLKISEGQKELVAKIVKDAQDNEIANNERLAKLELDRIALKERILKIDTDIENIRTQSELDSLKNQNELKLDELNTYNQKVLEGENVFSNNLLRIRKQLFEETEKLRKLEFEKREKQLIDKAEQAKKEAENIVEPTERAKKIEQIETQLNSDLIKLGEERSKVVAKANIDEYNQLKAIEIKKTELVLNDLQQVTESLGTELNRRNDRQQKALDYELDKRSRNIEKQRDLAQRGLANQLAFEEQQQAKTELKKQQLEERNQRRQEILEFQKLYLSSYNARLSQPNADPNTAPFLALKDVFTAKGLAKSVQFFNEGTEYVKPKGQSSQGIGHDYIPAMLAEGEAVVNYEANTKFKGVTKSLNEGTFDKYYMPITQLREVTSNIQKGTAQNMYNSLLVQEQYKTNALLEDLLKKPTQQVHVDTFGNLVETIYQQTEKTIITHKMPKRKL